MATKARGSRRSKRTSGKAKSRGTRKSKGTRRWSAQVMRTSDALDLEEGVFNKKTPRAVALSLKRSAERSRRRKASPYASAMSMLNFHINRAGRQLPAERRRVLNEAKSELRRLFHRTP